MNQSAAPSAAKSSSGANRNVQNWIVCASLPASDMITIRVPNRRSARAVRPWHPWHGHSLSQGCPGRREGVFRVLAGAGGIGGECFSWMGGGAVR
jgi:hypothetical protein